MTDTDYMRLIAKKSRISFRLLIAFLCLLAIFFPGFIYFSLGKAIYGIFHDEGIDVGAVDALLARVVAKDGKA